MNPAAANQYAYLTQCAQPQGWFAMYAQNVQQQEMMQLQSWFAAVDRDRGGSISAQELCALQFGGRNLSIQTSDRLVRTFDKDKSGSINFMEYVCLHRFIMQLQQAFMAADMDRSGKLTANEIYGALCNAGFNMLTAPTIQVLVFKYDKNRSGQVDFEEYLAICAHLAHLRSIFEWNSKGQPMVQLNYDQLSLISADMLSPY